MLTPRDMKIGTVIVCLVEQTELWSPEVDAMV